MFAVRHAGSLAGLSPTCPLEGESFAAKDMSCDSILDWKDPELDTLYEDTYSHSLLSLVAVGPDTPARLRLHCFDF